jgi:Tol biopolymer transport system component
MGHLSRSTHRPGDRSQRSPQAILDVKTGDIQALPKTGKSALWSPDGGHLVYFAIEEGEQFLYLADKFGDNREILISGAELGEGAFLALDFSPDGQTLLFVHAPQGQGFPFDENLVYSVKTDGHGLRKLANQASHPYNYPGWSSDGRHIASRNAEGKIRIAEIRYFS